MKKILVGRYAMNKSDAVLFLDPESDEASGTLGFRPKEAGGGYGATLTVGAKGRIWPQVVRKLLHEFLEMSAIKEGCHFHHSGDLLPVNADSYLLVMTHPEFARVVDEAGDALAYALDDARKVFDKLQKKETKK